MRPLTATAASRKPRLLTRESPLGVGSKAQQPNGYRTDFNTTKATYALISQIFNCVRTSQHLGRPFRKRLSPHHELRHFRSHAMGEIRALSRQPKKRS